MGDPPAFSAIKATLGLPLRMDPQQLIVPDFLGLKNRLSVEILELLLQQRKYPGIRGVVQQEYKVERRTMFQGGLRKKFQNNGSQYISILSLIPP